MKNNTVYTKYIKRFLDITLSFLGIILLSPIFLILAILIAVKLGRPIFFVQERVGYNNVVFKMYKFRSMTNEKKADGTLEDESVRLTNFGKRLRSTSLDELPELINIIKGDMSIIGPRPLPTKYLPLYNEQQIKRHDTKPGLTGLAQVNGRNNVDWNRRFELDVEYVNNITFWNDLKIFFKTILSVLKKEGIHSSETDGVIPAFQGSEVNNGNTKSNKEV